MAKLTVVEPAGAAMPGTDLLDLIFETIAEHFPKLAMDDPVRPYMARLLPTLNEGCGHPPLRGL